MKSYRDLEVWSLAMDLVEEVYRVCRQFPDDEKFALTSQIRRAAVSVPANIAEGWGRGSRAEYRHHVWIANGSLREVETLLIIAGRLKYVTSKDARPAWKLLQSVGKMLRALVNSLKLD